MTERKFTDEEVIRALECHVDFTVDNCHECPYLPLLSKYPDNCVVHLAKDTLDLINRQRAEIERLTTLAELGRMRANDYRAMRDKTKNARAEAIKEFAERLHKGIDDFRDKREMVMLPYTESALLCIERKIDNITKELTESKPCTEDADCSTCENCYHDGGYNECATDGWK